MSIVFFWTGKNYQYDRMTNGLDYRLNQNNPRLHDGQTGDHVWAFTRRPDGIYVLALDLVVSGKKTNTPQDEGYRYGRYGVWGDKAHSRYFNISAGPDFGPLLRSIFPPSKSSGHTNFPVGMSFQGEQAVKPLDPFDEKKLIDFASKCPVMSVP